jgi:hypothetical protein
MAVKSYGSSFGMATGGRQIANRTARIALALFVVLACLLFLCPPLLRAFVIGDTESVLVWRPSDSLGESLTRNRWLQIAKLTAYDGEYGHLGASSAIPPNGETVVAGAPNVQIGGSKGAGAAYVFVEQAGGWENMTYGPPLWASDAQAGDHLGNAIAISADGTTVIVGASRATVDYRGAQGAAYVFVEPSTGWPAEGMNETAKLIASDGEANDHFGSSVSISGNVIVVGAENAAIGSAPSQGAAYMFVEPANGWSNMTETAKLTASDGHEEDHVGSAVSIYRDTVAVGALQASATRDDHQGAIYLFLRPKTGWKTTSAFASKLTASDGQAGDKLGNAAAFSLDGTTLVAGAEGVKSGNKEMGAAYLFVKPKGGWPWRMTDTAKLTAAGASGIDFGSAVAIGNKVVVIGMQRATIDGRKNEGTAYLFVKPRGGWKTTSRFDSKLVASDGSHGDQFAASVATNDALTSAGSPNAPIPPAHGNGAVYVFKH